MLDLAEMSLEYLFSVRDNVYLMYYALALIDESWVHNYEYTNDNIEQLWDHVYKVQNLIVNSKVDLTPWQAAHILFKENFDLTNVDRYLSNYDYLFDPY